MGRKLEEIILSVPDLWLKGEFKVSSGEIADEYFDLWVLTTQEGYNEDLALRIRDVTEDWYCNCAAGLELASLPIMMGLLNIGEIDSVFLVRKQQKLWGTQKLIEGRPLDSNDRVLVVEDVISSGKSVMKAVNAVRDTGAIVKGVVTIIDREEGGRELLEENGVMMRSLTTMSRIRRCIDG
jgi:orotate phosphoribosyltransferase